MLRRMTIAINIAMFPTSTMPSASVMKGNFSVEPPDKDLKKEANNCSLILERKYFLVTYNFLVNLCIFLDYSFSCAILASKVHDYYGEYSSHCYVLIGMVSTLSFSLFDETCLIIVRNENWIRSRAELDSRAN